MVRSLGGPLQDTFAAVRGCQKSPFIGSAGGKPAGAPDGVPWAGRTGSWERAAGGGETGNPTEKCFCPSNSASRCHSPRWPLGGRPMRTFRPTREPPRRLAKRTPSAALSAPPSGAKVPVSRPAQAPPTREGPDGMNRLGPLGCRLGAAPMPQPQAASASSRAPPHRTASTSSHRAQCLAVR